MFVPDSVFFLVPALHTSLAPVNTQLLSLALQISKPTLRFLISSWKKKELNENLFPDQTFSNFHTELVYLENVCEGVDLEIAGKKPTGFLYFFIFKLSL